MDISFCRTSTISVPVRWGRHGSTEAIDGNNTRKRDLNQLPFAVVQLTKSSKTNLRYRILLIQMPTRKKGPRFSYKPFDEDDTFSKDSRI